MTEQMTVEQVPFKSGAVAGRLNASEGAAPVVILPQTSGSGRLHIETQRLERALRRRGFGTFVVDLLSFEEEQVDHITKHLRGDVPLLAGRLVTALDWLVARTDLATTPLIVLGLGLAAAPALSAAGVRSESVRAVAVEGDATELDPYLRDLDIPALCSPAGRGDKQMVDGAAMWLEQLDTAASA